MPTVETGEMHPPARAIERHVIAIVDSDETHRLQIARALFSFYRLTPYDNADAARIGMRKDRPSAVVVGEHLSPGNGYAFVRALRNDPSFADIAVVLIAAQDDLKSRDLVRYCGADAGLYRPFLRSQMIKTLSGLINAEVEGRWQTLPLNRQQALRGTVDVFNGISDCIEKGEPIAYASVAGACAPLVEAVRAQDYKLMLGAVRDHDNYTYVHSMRIATLLTLFGCTIGLSADDQLLLATGGLLHDVGKMNIPHEVLNKPGRLSAQEFAVMKTHVDFTLRYLAGYSALPNGIVTIAGQHHEKIDGSGYPNGASGIALNELARMAAIVDVFGALTDRRVYKPPMPAEEALSIMTEKMPGHLDGQLLYLFREMLLDTAIDTAPMGDGVSP